MICVVRCGFRDISGLRMATSSEPNLGGTNVETSPTTVKLGSGTVQGKLGKQQAVLTNARKPLNHITLCQPHSAPSYTTMSLQLWMHALR